MKKLTRTLAVAGLCFSIGGALLEAQSQPSVIQVLVGKARSLEGRGRLDLAADTWRQVLASDPNQQDALAALARYDKRLGKAEEAKSYLARLRTLNPNHPGLSEADEAPAASEQRSRLDQAAKLATSQHFEEAMAIYRQVFGDAPPPGNWSITYYETEASVPGGWEKATAALRKLSEEYPNVEEYTLSLGRLLTYRPATRQAGMGLLASIPSNGPLGAKARQSWKQALLWDKGNPASAASLHQYLERFPDAELKSQETALASETHRPEPPRVKPGGRDESLGYEALKAGKTGESEKYFSDALKQDPNSPEALAGMGYLRMKQQDFAGAVQYLQNAKREQPRNRSVGQALETAAFWKAMQDGTKFLDRNDTDAAEESYRAALKIHPNDPDAMLGLAGSLLRGTQFEEAVQLLERLVAQKPNDPVIWRRLVAAKYQTSGAKSALDALSIMPKAVAEQLNTKIEFLATTVVIYADAGQMAEAKALFRKVSEELRGGLDELTPAEQIQIAGLMIRFNQQANAIAVAKRVLDNNSKDLDAWEVYLAALVAQNKQKQAAEALSQIPDSVYNEGLRRPAFLRSVASIEANNGRLAEAEDALTKLAETEKGADSATGTATKLQLARVYLQQGRARRAGELLSELTESAPDNPDVWKAYAALLHERHRDTEAIALGRQMSHRVQRQLASDPDYISTMAAAQNALGNQEAALRLIHDAMAHAKEEGTVIPMHLQLQLAWILLNMPDAQSELYSVLQQAGNQPEVSSDEAKQLSQIWATWILRTAESASASGDLDRALAVLKQGSRMLPQDSSIQKSLAGNLLKAGDDARALVIYKNWGLINGDANDYAGAIGAAMTARDVAYTNAWLQDGLAKFPASPAILNLAGKQAASHGDYKKAKLYWKQALALAPSDTKDGMPGLLMNSEDKTGKQAEDKGDIRSLLVGPRSGPTNADDTEARSFQPELPAMKPISYQPDSDSDAAPDADLAPKVHFSRKPSQNLFGSTSKTALASASPDADPGDFPVRTNVALAGKGMLPQNDLVAPTTPAADTNSASAIQDEINSIDGRNTPYLGNDDSVQGRSGTAGFDKLLVEQANFEASTTIGDAIRLTIDAKPTHIETGAAQPNPNSTQQFGTLKAGSFLGEQSAGGTGADAQISGQSFGLHFGMTPNGFLVHNMTGGFRFTPGNGPITFVVDRDNIRDSFLSYAGSRDPNTGTVWGGAVSDTAAIVGNWGDERAGFYARAGYQAITGRNIQTNHRVDANGGRYWRVFARKDSAVTLGLNVSAMHYDTNLRYFTLGQGGYFSPQQYILFNAPLRWTGVYKRRLQYMVSASFGVQHFDEDASPYFPTDGALQLAEGNHYYAGQSSTGANYSLEARTSYQLTPNWFVGGYIAANNSRNYVSQTAGFFVKYSFEPRPLLQDSVVPSVPDWKGQQPFRLF